MEGTAVLGLGRTALFPSKDGFAFDVVGLKVLNIVGLTNRLDQSAHLVGKFGDKDHGLKMRRDGALRCCHSRKADEDSIDGESGISVPGDDNAHRRFELLIGSCDSGFSVGGVEVLPSHGSEHGVDIIVLLDGFLEKV